MRRLGGMASESGAPSVLSAERRACTRGGQAYGPARPPMGARDGRVGRSSRDVRFKLAVELVRRTVS